MGIVRIIEAPEKYDAKENEIKIFLAGTIDNGDSENWQKEICDYAKTLEPSRDVVIFNPRRENWNKTPDPEELENQIVWELENLERCDWIFMNILGTSKSPITLLEMGLFKNNPGLKVFCPPEFYRFDNVRVVCDRYKIKHYKEYTTEDIKKLLYMVV